MKEYGMKWETVPGWDNDVTDTEAAKACIGLVGDVLVGGAGEVLHFAGSCVAMTGACMCLLGNSLTISAKNGLVRHYSTIETYRSQKYTNN